jgi:hypothetical protein
MLVVANYMNTNALEEREIFVHGMADVYLAAKVILAFMQLINSSPFFADSFIGSYPFLLYYIIKNSCA